MHLERLDKPKPNYIHPEQIPENVKNAPKVLIDGWSKTLDWAMEPGCEKHDEAIAQFPGSSLQNLQDFIGDITTKAAGIDSSDLYFVGAGNTGGIQKRFFQPAENSGLKVLYGLPQGAEKYVSDTSATTIIYPPREGFSGSRDWGSELESPNGLASTDFNVNTVLLVGGGENVTNQMRIYLQNVLWAYLRGKSYKIIAVQGVGGFSDEAKLEPVLKQYANMSYDDFVKTFPGFEESYELYKSLFNADMKSSWIEYIPHNETDKIIEQLQEKDLSAEIRNKLKIFFKG